MSQKQVDLYKMNMKLNQPLLVTVTTGCITSPLVCAVFTSAMEAYNHKTTIRFIFKLSTFFPPDAKTMQMQVEAYKYAHNVQYMH